MTEQETPVQLPLLAAPRNTRVIMIETQDELDSAVTELAANAGPFALDAERASGFKYSARAYLVQVSRGDSPIYLIDPFAIAPEVSADPFLGLAKILSTDVWILHAATQDLACLAELGLKPTALFDTELGGRLAGFPRVGLGAMCESQLGYRLAKEHSAVDWSTRPMHADWLNYAALDVDVLVELMDAVTASLEEQGKTEFASQEFKHLLDFAPKGPKIDRWRGLNGLHEVKDSKRLAIARELWSAREALAQKLDVSPGRLIPDASIVAVVKNTPKSRSEMAARKDFHGRASRTYLDTWWKALEQGVNSLDLPPVKLPNTGIPNHRSWPNRFPEAEARLSKLKPVMLALSQAHNIPAENLLTPDYLRQLAWQPPESINVDSLGQALRVSGAREWQVEICAEPFVLGILGQDLPVPGDSD
jgi:ribonuclease D